MQFVIHPDDPNATTQGTVVSAKQQAVSAPVFDPSAKTCLIVDTNVLLKQLHIRELLRIDQHTFDQQFEVITLDRVISEVKDEKSRQYILNQLPYQIDVKNHETWLEKEDLEWVHNFAKETGDFQTLSKVDMMVIAMGVKVAREKGELALVRREPKDLTEFRPEQLKAAYDAWQSSEDSDDQVQEEEAGDDEWNDVQHTRQEKRTIDRLKKKEIWFAKKQQEKAEREAQYGAESNGDIDNEAEGGEWITSENLYSHISHGDAQAINLITQDPKPELGEDGLCNDVALSQAKPAVQESKDQSPRKIIFLTSDFAMQNVIIQMGFVLITMDGLRLTRVKRFKLLCRACFKLNLDTERKFCEKCGAHILTKVSCFINESGQVTFFDNPKRRVNLRGTIYSIPKPKGGRNNGNLILREDEFMTGDKMMKMKRIEREKEKEKNAIKNTLEGNYWAGGQGYGAGVSSLLYDNGAKGGNKSKNNIDLKVGHGKKNPNIARRKV